MADEVVSQAGTVLLVETVRKPDLDAAMSVALVLTNPGRLRARSPATSP